MTLTAPYNFNGELAVAYTTVDEKGAVSINTATDIVNVEPRPVKVRALDDAFTLVQGHSVGFTLDQLLGNDRDDNGNSFRMVQIAQPAHGSLVMTTASVDLAPPAALSPSASALFSAVLADRSALPAWMVLDPTTGHITARPPLDYLGTQSVNFTLSDGTTTQGATATYALDGNVSVSFVYTPDPAYYGDDSLVYALTDDKQAPVQATVNLKVAAALVAKDGRFFASQRYRLCHRSRGLAGK